MSFKDCMAAAVDGGDISKADADRLEQRFADYRSRYTGGSDATASMRAKDELAKALTAENLQKRRQAKLQLKALQRIELDRAKHRTPSGKISAGDFVLDLLEDPAGNTGIVSVQARHGSLLGMAHAKMSRFLLERKTNAGRAAERNIIRERFGEDTGDVAAKELSDAIGATTEWLRQRFNAAGGAIGKLDNWGLPQHHDARALIGAGLEGWKTAIKPMLDVSRILNPLTGDPIAPRELDGILDDIWHTIATDGWIDRKPSMQPYGKGALANQNAEHRFLVFKSADEWLRYQEDFGSGDPFSALMGHIDRMSRDIAAMEILGPNPDGMVTYLKQVVERDGAIRATKGGKGADTARDRASRKVDRIETVWQSMRGTLNTPVNARFAHWMGGLRALKTASVLGSAVLSSVSDVATSMIAKRFAGLPAWDAGIQIVKSFSSASRAEAVEAGLILDSAMEVFHRQARYAGTLSGPEFAQRLASGVLKYSGLSPWTQAAKHAFGLTFMAEGARHAGTPFADLPAPFRDTLRRYGFDELDWKLIGHSATHQAANGLTLLRPSEIEKAAGDKRGLRWLEMILTETEYAVPSGSHRSRTTLVGKTRAGTIQGEFMRSFAMFKNFGITLMMMHGARVHSLIAKGNTARGVGYATSLLATSTLAGAIAIELKQIVAGRDARDMDNAAYWGAALLQGGGLGIFGDFLFSDINRFGGGFAETLGGPVASVATDFWNLTAGNVVQLGSGEKTNFGRELVHFLKGNVPGGNIWYLRLAWERTMLDNLQRMVDPEAEKAFKKQQQYWMKNYGQEFWWAPGTGAPKRGPDLFPG